MSLETASYIASLVATNPDGADARNTADDHIRLIKACLKRTFPQVDGAISLSSVQFAYLNDVSKSVQLQLNTLRDGSATANNALYANSSSYAAFSGQGTSASFATLAATANSASYASFAGQAASASFATFAQQANSASYATLALNASTANNANTATTAGFAQQAGSASFATVAALATTATTASNANALNGLASSSSASGSTIAARNSSGDIFARYFNQSSGVETGAVSHLITQQGDAYQRVATVAHAGQYIAGQNVSGRTGTSKTLSSSAPSGGSNGDIWYQY